MGLGLDGGGCMNGNQFMGIRIRFDGGGHTNNARKSIRGAPDSMGEEV